jgi:diaminohydroxyphosphoribosylaminopyrimidine deaminase/5-amino-6-(5-phosphoribosylamino)uracil reductase
MASDLQWMARALQLAERGRYSTRPNPRVGCVLVKQDQFIAEGWHRYAGEGHAEVNALTIAGDDAKGSTAYVTLEPCSHKGKTGPCSQALIEAGIVRVVVAMQDPNPLVAGRGISALQKAGIAVECGVMEAQAKQMNPGFIKRMTSGLPYVRCKMAMSLDGRTAMSNGESQWITGTAARGEVQRLRAQSCAILTGVGSILIDDSRLTVRDVQIPEQYDVSRQHPLRVVLDSRLCTPLDAAVIGDDKRSLILYSNSDVSNADDLRKRGAQVIRISGQSNAVDLEAALRYLAEKEQCNDILLEAGATLTGAMMEAGLIDELHLFIAPIFMGSEARPLMQLPLFKMTEKLNLDIVDVRAFGDDWRVIAKPKE